MKIATKKNISRITEILEKAKAVSVGTVSWHKDGKAYRKIAAVKGGGRKNWERVPDLDDKDKAGQKQKPKDLINEPIKNKVEDDEPKAKDAPSRVKKASEQVKETFEKHKNRPVAGKDIDDVRLPDGRFEVEDVKNGVYSENIAEMVLNRFNFHELIQENAIINYRDQPIKIGKIYGSGVNARVEVYYQRSKRKGKRKFTKNPDRILLYQDLAGQVTPATDEMSNFRKNAVVGVFMDRQIYTGIAVGGGKQVKGMYQYYKVKIPAKNNEVISVSRDKLVNLNQDHIQAKISEINKEEQKQIKEDVQKNVDLWKERGYSEKERGIYWKYMLAPIWDALENATENFFKNVAEKRNFRGIDDIYGNELFFKKAVSRYEKSLLDFLDATKKRGKEITTDWLQKLSFEKQREVGKIMLRFMGVACYGKDKCYLKVKRNKEGKIIANTAYYLRKDIVSAIGKMLDFLPISHNQERSLAFIKEIENRFELKNGRLPTNNEHWQAVSDFLSKNDRITFLDGNSISLKTIRRDLKGSKNGRMSFDLLKEKTNYSVMSMDEVVKDTEGNEVNRGEIVAGGENYQLSQGDTRAEIIESVYQAQKAIDIMTRGGVNLGGKKLTDKQFSLLVKHAFGSTLTQDLSWWRDTGLSTPKNVEQKKKDFFVKFGEYGQGKRADWNAKQKREQFYADTGISLNKDEFDLGIAKFTKNLNNVKNKAIKQSFWQNMTAFLKKAKQLIKNKNFWNIFKSLIRYYFKYLWDDLSTENF